MALTREKKAANVQQLAAELESSTSAIVGTFTKLTAGKDFELRKTIRLAGGRYHVVKNKLAERAGEGTKVEAALKGLKGVSSVAYTSGDPVALAKALSTWVKDNAEFTFKLGIVDGKVLSVEEVGALATMPGKEELFSKLLFLINSPAQRLATVIHATGRDLAVVINQAVELEKFKGTAAAEAGAASPASVTEAPATETVDRAAEGPAQDAAGSGETVSANEAGPSAAGPVAAEAAQAHEVESAAGEQPSGAAQPENATATQGGEAASTEPVEG